MSLNLRCFIRVNRVIHATSFTRITSQDASSHPFIDLTFKSSTLDASSALSVNAGYAASDAELLSRSKQHIFLLSLMMVACGSQYSYENCDEVFAIVFEY